MLHCAPAGGGRPARGRGYTAPSSRIVLRKASKELLDLRRKQVMVAKQGDYADAQKLKTRADALEAEEAERREREAEQHALLAEVKFMRRQEQELNALRKRIQTGAEEQRHARELDLERLLQRYQNVKSELEAQQTAERHRQKKGAAGQGLLQSGLGSSASVARPWIPPRTLQDALFF